MRKVICCLLIVILILLSPEKIFSAEVLQVKDSRTLLIGDQNRNYSVRLSCIEIEPSKEKEAKIYLQSILPRHSKVNLKPKGSFEGLLISRVIKIGSDDDIGTQIVSKGFAFPNC